MTRIAVVGNGMAGIRLVEELLALGHDGANITVFGAEPGGAYNRILLTAVLAGELQENACISHNLAWYRARGIALRARCPIRTIDRAAHQAIAADGTRTAYDRLALALGSQPIRLALPGAKLAGIMTYRDRGDTRALIAASTAGGRAVVIGGGLLGLEAAAGLARRGMTVTIVHLMPWLMERQLDEEASALVRRALEARGITVRLRAETARFEGDAQVRAVALKDGSVLPADLVVTAIGIRPETGLAAASGLACGRGIQVDDGMTTSDPAILALGECIEHGGRTYGLVGPIYEQAKIAAQSLRGRATRYAGSAAATGLKVTGISLYSAGDISDRDGTQSVTFRDPRRGLYRRLFVRPQGDDTVLTGAILVGAVADGAWYAELIADATPLGVGRHDLIFGRAYADSSRAA